MKSKRHERILQLIVEEHITTQEELLSGLKASGFNVTQATVSRDIKELKLLKSLSEDGKYRYSVSADNSTETQVDMHLLAEAIAKYLHQLSPETRNLFVGRYYYFDSLKEVAAYYGFSQSKAKSMLHRTRIGLKKYLEQEGFEL